MKPAKHLAAALLSSAALLALCAPASAADTVTVAAATVNTNTTAVAANATGSNWKVQSPVRSDGFMRLYTLETPYGVYQVSGERLLAQRLQELKAVEALEQMSKGDAFVEAAGNAGMAPLRFGRDMVSAPIETTDRLFSGVAHMFDKVGTEIENSSTSRDSFVESVTGEMKARRELAFQLGVDPYSDFPPLDKGLEGIAEMMALGDISVSAAISAIPGGAGIAVSATSRADSLSQPLRDKSSAEIAGAVSEKLEALGVSEELTETFLKNAAYSPADLLAIAEALTTLNAESSEVFIARAATADTVDVAKFQRYRAETMAKESAKLGSLVAFEEVSGFALNRDKSGAVVAVFPFDQVVWTDIASKAFQEMSADLDTRGDKATRVLATAADVSEASQEELTKLGWQIKRL